MCHDKATVRACQYPPGPAAKETTPPPPGPAAKETTPPPPATAPEGIDRRLVVRYGAWLLVGGYTALPTYAWVYYARLGVSEAEMVLIAQLCTYWWTERDPFPGEAALAARMGKTVRTIQGYLCSLEGKGLLHIQTQFSSHGRQSTNAYDLRPFFAAVEGLARLDGLACLDGLLPVDDGDAATPALSPRGRAHQSWTAGDPGDTASCMGGPGTPTTSCMGGPGTPTTDTQGDAEQRSLCAGTERHGPDNRPKDAGTPTRGEGEGSRAGGVKNPSPQVNPIEIDSFDFDSIPPTPINTSSRPATSGGDGPTAASDPDDQALAAEVPALSDELGDDAPGSSLGRARNLRRDAGVPLDRFLRLLDEAAARTRDRQASIVKRRRDGQAPNGMPYLFAVLQDLVHPAPPRTRDGSPDADRRQSGPPSRRRRRCADGRSEPARSYAAWSNSPAPLPIVEEHPVWRAALAELAQVMTPENYNAWLASTRALDQDGDVLRVAVPAAFTKTWLEQKLHGKVTGALHTIDYDALGAGRVERVEYVVEEAA